MMVQSTARERDAGPGRAAPRSAFRKFVSGPSSGSSSEPSSGQGLGKGRHDRQKAVEATTAKATTAKAIIAKAIIA
ncbi:hypothetical protein [Nguyenibacter sp. L1]|uniref:hypothetical protein n=1 Tax=Nguyenibacter sp. L1 TaxID=3049350 RepID=UPI002B474E27|nr:hypothetical protein [Nguyenibacter sp. L1]WRH88891.1 hypothetical protein QN315_04510 [Nguyenibacter sp. L1]